MQYIFFLFADRLWRQACGFNAMTIWQIFRRERERDREVDRKRERKRDTLREIETHT